jgi:hypothetical protein
MALQTATDALRRLYILPATMEHPVVFSQALELAYMLSAYGLVPDEEHPEALQSDSVADFARKSSRNTVLRKRRRGPSPIAAADTAVDALN